MPSSQTINPQLFECVGLKYGKMSEYESAAAECERACWTESLQNKTCDVESDKMRQSVPETNKSD